MCPAQDGPPVSFSLLSSVAAGYNDSKGHLALVLARSLNSPPLSAPPPVFQPLHSAVVLKVGALLTVRTQLTPLAATWYFLSQL